MTKDEVKDLIDSTINDNGQKQITGKTLNLVLNEVANIVPGSTTIFIRIPDTDNPQTDEEKAQVAEIRTQVLAYLNGTSSSCPIVWYKTIVRGLNICSAALWVFQEDQLFNYVMMQLPALIAEDGTITLQSN